MKHYAKKQESRETEREVPVGERNSLGERNSFEERESTTRKSTD